MRLQEAGDVQLPLSQEKSLLQVFLIASRLDQGEIHQLRPERAQDGQEGLPTSPAGPEVPHADRAANPGQTHTHKHTNSTSGWFCGTVQSKKNVICTHKYTINSFKYCTLANRKPVFHIKRRLTYNFHTFLDINSPYKVKNTPFALVPDPHEQSLLGRHSEASVER